MMLVLPRSAKIANVTNDIIQAKCDKMIKIAIVSYPDSLQSAVFGLAEMFQLANRNDPPAPFQCDIVTEDVPSRAYNIVILPPNLGSEYTEQASDSLNTWLCDQKQQGAILCAACAGCFILGQSIDLTGRRVTTHWALADKFRTAFPKTELDSDKILINDGDLITAGGLMAWVDLGLELIAQFSSPTIMRKVGKTMVVDTARREQRFYKRFSPRRDHGDQAILNLQNHLEEHYHQPMTVSKMADFCGLEPRSFLRHFTKCCQLTPKLYQQQLRIQKACDLLEGTPQTIDQISYHVGYEDISAFRRTFVKVMGLTPRDFRNRFGEANFAL